MTIDRRLTRLRVAMEKWPAGMRVWHRACGTRGVILQHIIDGDGKVLLGVCFGAAKSIDHCNIRELSATRIHDDRDGDEWRDTETES